MTEASTQEVGAATEVAAQPEAEQEQTATPNQDTEAGAGEKDTQGDEKSGEERKFTQAEMDEIISKRLAKEAAKVERRTLKAYAQKLEEAVSKVSQPVQHPQTQAQSVPEGAPKIEQFKTVEEYLDARDQWRDNQRVQEQQRQQAEQREAGLRERAAKLFAEAEKNPEFDKDAFAELPVSDPMAFAIMDSDIPDKLMVHLTNNPEEAERIANLSPARQAAEIGKLEVKLSAPKEVKASSVPPPVKPIGARGSNASGNPAEMTQEQYEAYRKKNGASWARR